MLTLYQEPKLWYGIGILYDRYGSLEHAEEAFSQVMSMQPDFEKANEIYFRLGIIYKQQSKYDESLQVRRIREDLVLVLIIGSVSNILYKILLDLLQKKTSGSKSAMFMSSRKTFVRFLLSECTELMTVVV